jgi:hypothetical protein
MSLNAPDHSLDHESMSELMMGLSATLGFITTSVVIARLYTRLVQLRNFGADDAMIAVTQILAIGLNVSTCLGASTLGVILATVDTKDPSHVRVAN